ncbi:MAG: hypothetical protein Q7J24_10090 [Desulfomicrobium sp.]|nr:hypothetical protein [Desulfomicrobium sp.]
MQVKASELLAKIREMYPEIEKNGVQTSCHYDEKTEAWLVEFTHGDHSLETHLDRKDVEDCLAGRKCIHMGVQVGRFVESYCLKDNVCPTDIKK